MSALAFRIGPEVNIMAASLTADSVRLTKQGAVTSIDLVATSGRSSAVDPSMQSLILEPCRMVLVAASAG